jgi:hypothetical protein
MRRWNLLPLVLLGAAACGGDEAADDQAAVDSVPVEQPAPAAVDTTTVTPQAAETVPAPAAEVPPRVAPVRMPETEEPWTPTHTGTVNPGMTRDEVVGVWGPPVAERALGSWTYLYFRNGCEASCGTFDVVFLENGAVVNAIVRGPGHTYGGTSTSPPGAVGRATLPSGTED